MCKLCTADTQQARGVREHSLPGDFRNSDSLRSILVCLYCDLFCVFDVYKCTYIVQHINLCGFPL